jgi:(5-formylfuran-3-yl)methyl phosphate synthase
MTRLLVSVRCAAEARAALAGGAALLDVKEPAHGPLGRAPDSALTAVLDSAGGTPVSAALGELADTAPGDLPAAVGRLAFVKWGLAGRAGAPWERALAAALDSLAKAAPGCRGVAVAYADWRRASAPPVDGVCAFALGHPAGALLIDTWGKDGTTLLDWLPLAGLARLCARCRAAGRTLALAGSLGPAEVAALLPLAPDWLAVRGAACRGRDRQAAVDAGKVRRLAALVAGCQPGHWRRLTART